MAVDEGHCSKKIIKQLFSDYNMQIINPNQTGDYHLHSLNYSDGLNTIDELVHWAGIFGLKEIAITDHSQATIEKHGLARKGFRKIVQTERRWQNVHDNGVNVIFGVEGDVLNSEGDICDQIQGVEGDFLVLSLHKDVYSAGFSGDYKFTGDFKFPSDASAKPDFSKVTQAYCRALERHHQKIKVLGHPCIKQPHQQYLDIVAVTELANHYGIPLEFNCANFTRGKTDLEQLKKMLDRAERIYINSDAHSLYELKMVRSAGFKYLEEKGYIK